MDISPEVWTFLGVIVAQAAVIAVAVVNNTSTKRKVAEVQQTAQTAVDQSKPTANGFAGKTLGSLERIESLVAELKTDVQRQGERLDRHLEAHISRPRGRWWKP